MPWRINQARRAAIFITALGLVKRATNLLVCPTTRRSAYSTPLRSPSQLSTCSSTPAFSALTRHGTRSCTCVSNRQFLYMPMQRNVKTYPFSDEVRRTGMPRAGPPSDDRHTGHVRTVTRMTWPGGESRGKRGRLRIGLRLLTLVVSGSGCVYWPIG